MTICAISTSQGGAIGIIRTSGPEAIHITDKIFHARKSLLEAKSHTQHFGHIMEGKEIIDEVLVSVFRAPHSYTGEDATEISCHGSSYILQKILQLLIQAGCRMAQPGEFTQRAFQNGKMDLSQAEAVADLIASTNEVSHRVALSQLRGHFSSRLTQLRDQLLHLTTLLELELDFSDHEDLEFADRTDLLTLANDIDSHITHLAHSFKTGQAIKKGIPVAIVGKTNAGKSTLLNRLLQDERAIVSDIHGTTRDTIEDTADIHGITFRFIDTAGIRTTNDAVEQIGIQRTYQSIQRATIVIWLIDEQPTPSETIDILNRTQDKSLLIVRNKIDLIPDRLPKLSIPSSTSLTVIPISARQGINITELQEAIYAATDIPDIHEGDTIVTSARHYEALTHAHTNLIRVIEGLTTSLSGDLIAEDLRLVLADLADITGGSITSQETLNNVFSHFCVGK